MTQQMPPLKLHLDALTWLPPYKCRVSARARRIAISMGAEGVELVLPKGVSPDDGAAFLQEKKAWIQRHWHLIEKKRASAVQAVPNKLALQALGENWHYEIIEASPLYYVRVSHNDQERRFCLGRDNDPKLAYQQLQSWLKERAYNHFKAGLDACSKATGLAYQRLQIRNQKGCWGSCSSKGTISLNLKLLFLPPSAVQYVMIHELCHTRHANHSKRFWALVAKFVPDYEHENTVLRHARDQMPVWLLG
jgi:predicted metal-dependent hydrolase